MAGAKQDRKYTRVNSPSPMGSCTGRIPSGCTSFVAVVQSTNLGYCYYSSQLRWLDWPRFRRILLQRKMRPRLVIVGEIARQSSPQGGFPEDDHMIEAIAPNGTDHALHVGPPPRRSRSREHFLNVHVLYLLPEGVAENPVAIAEQIARGLIERKCFAQLLCRPFRRGVRGDIKVDHPAPVMANTRNTYSTWNRIVGTVKKSMETRFWT